MRSPAYVDKILSMTFEFWKPRWEMLSPKQKRVINKAYTDAARGQECTLRFPGCNRNPETTVACHPNGAGYGLKHHDLMVVDGCSACHHFFDEGWVNHGWTKEEVQNRYFTALGETMARRHEQGFRMVKK